ncbi:MAG: hypothetical protein ACE37K_18015 [Planctomycetota bacterium]|jgi:hypothetical protein
MKQASLLAFCILTACGADAAPTFDPLPFVGTWRGRWKDDTGRRGGLEMRVVDNGTELEFECDLLGGALPGVTVPTERFVAEVGAHQATLRGHDSFVFGEITGHLLADGTLVIDCDGVRGNVSRLHAEGSWSGDKVELLVDVSYDGSLRTSVAEVSLARM